MIEVVLFGEDFGHETVVRALILRLAGELRVETEVSARSVRGGHGAVETELAQYLRDVRAHREPRPDLVVAAVDCNCRGLQERRKSLAERVERLGMADLVVYALPDPHVEKWLMLDPEAFKRVFGRGCTLAREKCEKSRYKRLLLDQIRVAGMTPLTGGIEFADDVVAEMDLYGAADSDRSIGRFLDELKAALVRLRSQT